MVVGGGPLLPEILGQPATVRWSEIADFEPIFAHSASAVTPSENSSINTDRKYTMRFPTSPRWSSYVAPKPPKGTEKRKTAVFSVKSHFVWRKSATKFLCVKTVSDKVVRHSLAYLSYLSMRKWFVGRPLLPEILGQSDRIGAKSPIFDLFSPVAPQP